MNLSDGWVYQIPSPNDKVFLRSLRPTVSAIECVAFVPLFHLPVEIAPLQKSKHRSGDALAVDRPTSRDQRWTLVDHHHDFLRLSRFRRSHLSVDWLPIPLFPRPVPAPFSPGRLTRHHNRNRAAARGLVSCSTTQALDFRFRSPATGATLHLQRSSEIPILDTLERGARDRSARDGFRFVPSDRSLDRPADGKTNPAAQSIDLRTIEPG